MPQAPLTLPWPKLNELLDRAADRHEGLLVVDDDPDFLRTLSESRTLAAANGGALTVYRLLLENISDVIAVAEADNTLRYVSPSIGRVLGYSPEELIGTSALVNVHPEDLLLAERFIQDVLARPSGPVSLECRIRHRDARGGPSSCGRPTWWVAPRSAASSTSGAR